MKSNSDNFRESSIQDIIEKLSKSNINICIYEPTIKQKTYCGYRVVSNIDNFKEKCDLIIANRTTLELKDVENKTYCRDIFFRD